MFAQGTLWQIGTFNAENGTFSSTASAGHEQGLGSCGQSLTDAKGRRVQFGWQHISLGVTSGAQSLPRVITAATEAQGGGLRFSPLPELETLHNDSTLVSLNFTAGAGPGFKMLDSIDQHVRPPRFLARRSPTSDARHLPLVLVHRYTLCSVSVCRRACTTTSN
jgi:hypothetical protein